MLIEFNETVKKMIGINVLLLVSKVGIIVRKDVMLEATTWKQMTEAQKLLMIDELAIIFFIDYIIMQYYLFLLIDYYFTYINIYGIL